MNPYLKMALLLLGTALLAVAASRFVQLSSTETLRLYEAKYQELASKPSVTAEERQELDRLFKELNSAKNIRADLIDFAVKYAALFLVVVPLMIYAAKWLAFDDTPTMVASGLVFLIFILAGLMVSGAIFASVFFIASVTFRKRRLARQAS